MPDRDDENRRAIARRKTRVAGDRSARLARELMQLADSLLGKLELEEELHEAIVAARKITAPVARRRAERTLAGDLRRFDTSDLEQRLANARATGAAEPARLHLAERWRTRFLDEGIDAIAAFPPGDPDHVLPGLIAKAQRERTSGKPPGSGRALFRHIAEALKHAEAVAAADED
jgi:ribosome-associated protein